MRQVAYGAHENRGDRTDPPISSVVLQARANHPHVLEPQFPNRVLQEAGLLLAGLEQDNGRLWPRDRQRNSGKSRAAPDVESRRRGPLEGRKRIEGVEDVSRVDRGPIAVGDQGERCGRIMDQASIPSEERERLGRRARGRRARGRSGTDRRLKLAVVLLQIRGEVARRRGVVRVRHRW